MIRNLIALACLFGALISCDRAEHKLEGKWQLKTVEADGVVQTVDTVWYNFQTSLFQYQLYDASKGYLTMLGYKTLEDDKTLEIELIKDEGSLPLDKFLSRTDWTTPKRLFRIEKSTVKNLGLSSEGKTYTFKKF